MKTFDYIDRYENTLYRLVLWWAQLVPPEHAPSQTELICDYGDSMRLMPYALESVAMSLPRGENAQVPVNFVDYSGDETVRTFMEPGDQIVFDEEAQTLTLVRKQ